MKTRILLTIASTIIFLTSCASGKYVNYLKDHTEVVQMTDSLQFNSLDNDFYSNKLFLVGEVHEVATSPRIDFAMFTQLHDKINIDTYLAEMDLAQGYYLQKYIEGSDELTLKEILNKWSVGIGSISQQYRNKWKQMRAYYTTLSDDKKFELIGIDRVNDFGLVRKLLKEKLPQKYHEEIPVDTDALIAWSKNTLNIMLTSEQSEFKSEDLKLLKDVQFNLSNLSEIRSRDKFMHENFKRYYAKHQENNPTVYGNFGFAHTLQAYKYTFAGRMKTDTTMPYHKKMISMNALYVDSRLTVESNHLPMFMQDKGKKFTRFKYSQDNRLFMYIQGIADYKKVTESNTISLMKLNAKGSPYLNSTRGTKVKKLITIWDAYDIIEGTSTTDYAQYIFFVRNADWIQPDEL
ncbi:hypothetical protein [uncultured Dokdonia sp.]|uniref:hypothetical protein n=1 Tax=uncultured Dokdonia sp. TaxID=575653 RepID=UPI00261A6D55|nr:hypothetical protein [uncultured Dokdonia sp.]